MSRSPDHVDEAVEEVVRSSYGRLVAYLGSVTRDLTLAEDALADALEAALRTWPARGVPERPDAWLLTAARRSLIGRARRAATAQRNLSTLAVLGEELRQRAGAREPVVPDKRLELLYACAHPAIDSTMHAPLMLQVVLGIDAARIAAALLVTPTSLSQRLVRAKRKLRDAGVAFAVPTLEDLPERTGAVLDAIYAAYTTGWEHAAGGPLALEAIRLVELLVELRPDDPEVHGLVGLLHHSHARAGSLRGDDGRFVALAEQDPGSWSRASIEIAERHLAEALALRSIGPYQLQAAIQSVHNRRALTGRIDWLAIRHLYDGLCAIDPSIGAAIGRAVAVLETTGPVDALAALRALDRDLVDAHQPWWVATAEASHRAGCPDAADAARRAIDLTVDPAVRAHLTERFAPLFASRPPIPAAV